MYSSVISFVNVTVAAVTPSLKAKNLRAKSFVASGGTCSHNGERNVFGEGRHALLVEEGRGVHECIALGSVSLAASAKLKTCF